MNTATCAAESQPFARTPGNHKKLPSDGFFCCRTPSTRRDESKGRSDGVFHAIDARHHRSFRTN